MEGRHKCPVCGKYEFDEYNSLEYCEECGWFDDALQAKNPDMTGGANEMSLAQARKAYKDRASRVYAKRKPGMLSVGASA